MTPAYLTIHDDAHSTLTEIDADDRDLIVEKIKDVATGRRCNVESVDGVTPPVKRLRAGDYRVFFLEHRSLIIVLYLTPRRNAYNRSAMQTIEARARSVDPTDISPDTDATKIPTQSSHTNMAKALER